MDVPRPTSASNGEATQRPWGSDGRPKDVPPLYTEPSDAKFRTEEWAQKFQDGSWSWPAPPPNPPSPTKGNTGAGIRKQSQGRKASRTSGKKGPAGVKVQPSTDRVDEDDTTEIRGADGEPEHGVPIVDDGDAMDVDSTPPNQQKDDQPQDTPTPAGQQQSEARPYYVPKSQWREQQDQQRSQQPNGHRKTSSASRRAQRASVSSSGARLNTSLDDLRNVEPISRTAHPTLGGEGGGGGFANMAADIGSTLPFTSQASTTLPTHPLDPKKLQIPKVPTAPDAPQRLTKLSWQAYAARFGDYLKAHYLFDNAMLAHFNARQHQDQALMAGEMGWLTATGDPAGGEGFGAFVRRVREDESVREAWAVGCERQREAVLGFDRLRQRVRRLVEANTLAES